MFDHFHATYKQCDNPDLWNEIEGGLTYNDPINTGEFKEMTPSNQDQHLYNLAHDWGMPDDGIIIGFRVAG